MMKSWVSQLLIVLIAMQSVMAVADVHLEHESSVPHLEESLLLDVNATPDVDPSGPPATDIDCQHCCHCHSPQLNPLDTLFSAVILIDSEKHVIDLNNATPFSLASQLFKPPRAHS